MFFGNLGNGYCITYNRGIQGHGFNWEKLRADIFVEQGWNLRILNTQ